MSNLTLPAAPDDQIEQDADKTAQQFSDSFRDGLKKIHPAPDGLMRVVDLGDDIASGDITIMGALQNAYLRGQQSAEAQQVAQVEAWQPIETAPKGETEIILYWNGFVLTGYWLDNSSSEYQPWSGWKPTGMRPFPKGKPAHWMPLPIAPHQMMEKLDERIEGASI